MCSVRVIFLGLQVVDIYDFRIVKYIIPLKILKEYRVERVYQDIESGGKRNRVEFNRMLDQLRKYDLVVVEGLQLFL